LRKTRATSEFNFQKIKSCKLVIIKL